MKNRLLKKKVIGYAFISPWLLGFLVFTAGPFKGMTGQRDGLEKRYRGIKN